MIEFVEECRREWRSLGVPDPIANEMATDLTADIEEAESEGGSAEDVLGNSFFDPRRFAAAWAGARGVTAPSAPSAPSVADRSRWHWPVLAVTLASTSALIVLAAALLVGRHSAAVAAPVSRILRVPYSFGSGPVKPPFGIFVPGPSFGVQHSAGFELLILVLLLVGVAGLGLAALYIFPWSRRRLNLTARKTGRTRWPEGSSR